MLFQTDHRQGTDRQRKLFAVLEILYTAIDFSAAAFFVVGSFMFLSPDWERTGTYLFIAGSFLFAAKPTLRLVRELKLAAIGDSRDLARRLDP